jgi:GNAT superfamily N-acetyltransferase
MKPINQQSLLAADLRIVSLRTEGESPIIRRFYDWVGAMTPARDGEDGPDFAGFIKRHLIERHESGLTDTLFLVKTDAIAATVSIVLDDRDVGKPYCIDGLWIAGLNVRPEFRGIGLSRILLKEVCRRFQAAANHWTGFISANLYSTNSSVIHLAGALGFLPCGRRWVEHFKKDYEFLRREFKRRSEIS